MKELPHAPLLRESFIKKGIRLAAKKIIPLSTTTSLILASCGGEKNNTQELKNNESSGYSLPFPEGETWYLTTGPHGDGLSAINIAPPELGRLNGNCPTDGSRLSIDNRVVTASASGEVTVKGDDGNRNDPFHSIIDIKDNSGLTQRFVHLDKTKVKLGDKVRKGEALGNPSCESPPGGGNSGPHVHVGLLKDGQPVPINGVVVGGWTIHENGTMTKPGETTRTANTGRYGENSTGIRNDLPNNPNKAVVAVPKDPIRPISATIIAKEVFPATAAPTAKPTETPKPTSTVEKPVEQGWRRFQSSDYPYKMDVPSTWVAKNIGRDYFTENEGDPNASEIFIEVSPTNSNLDDYIQNFISEANSEGANVVIGSETNVDKNLAPLLKLKLAGQRISFLVDAGNDNPTMEGIGAFSIVNGNLWEISIITERSGKHVALLEKIFSTFSLTDSVAQTAISEATETKKPAVENKISISKKPDELFRALLTNPISTDILPQGMSSRGISAGEIDATGKALKEIGAVTIAIEDSVSTDVWKTPGSGKIFYGIFPDSSAAKSASEIIGTHLGNEQVIKDFPYPTKIYTIESGIGGVSFSVTKVLVTSVENITVATSLTGVNARGVNADLVQSRAILLAHAAIEHLGKVGK